MRRRGRGYTTTLTGVERRRLACNGFPQHRQEGTRPISVLRLDRPDQGQIMRPLSREGDALQEVRPAGSGGRRLPETRIYVHGMNVAPSLCNEFDCGSHGAKRPRG